MKIDALPIQKTFDLESDPDGNATVTVMQARHGEDIERNDMFSSITRIYEDPILNSIGLDGRLKLQTNQNILRIRRKEAYLTLARISGITDGSGHELFRSKDGPGGERIRYAMDESEFAAAWGMLPNEVIREISEKIYEVNPHWAPDYQGE